MTGTEFSDPLTPKIVAFLREIGVAVRAGVLEEGTFLPGIEIRDGGLVVDPTRLLYPGDLLHEAGHLAVLTGEERGGADGDVGDDGGSEMAAIAWSYAAAVHLGLAPEVVFHPDGYRGGASALVKNFTQGRYVGLPLLQWMGLTLDEKAARARGAEPYPRMVRWLRE